MRYFYNKRDYTIDYSAKVVRINPELHQKMLKKECVYPKTTLNFGYKKIGGSSLGDILESTSFSSPFKAFCGYAYIAPKPLVMKYINAGIAIEPKVIEALEFSLNKNKAPVDRVRVEGIRSEDYNYNYFKDYDELINGVPDGLIHTKTSKVLIEIKTAGEKKFDYWFKNNPPVNYKKQAQLYAYILNIKKFWIVATFLQEEDYENPNEYPVYKRRLKNWSYEVNEKEARDDMEYAKSWYHKYVMNGISPTFDLNRDAEILEFLECENEEQWENLILKWKATGKCDQDYKG